MSEVTSTPERMDTGLEVVDLFTHPEFVSRPRRVRDDAPEREGLRRLASTFVDRPDTLLQELVNCAITLCGAESAGISLQETGPDGEITYRWVATAGTYARFLNAILPATPSACGLCLERNRPQLFRVTQTFFDTIGVVAEPAMDGVLIPWHVDDCHGTIWIIAHTRDNAFDLSDAETMQLLADFAAMSMRQRSQQQRILDQATAAAAAEMANELAHKINNPLQSLTNLVYLAAQGKGDGEVVGLARAMSDDLRRLSSLVSQLLILPTGRL